MAYLISSISLFLFKLEIYYLNSLKTNSLEFIFILSKKIKKSSEFKIKAMYSWAVLNSAMIFFFYNFSNGEI